MSILVTVWSLEGYCPYFELKYQLSLLTGEEALNVNPYPGQFRVN
jgi:hypothetical protein